MQKNAIFCKKMHKNVQKMRFFDVFLKNEFEKI